MHDGHCQANADGLPVVPMSEALRYEFDVRGWILLPGLLTEACPASSPTRHFESPTGGMSDLDCQLICMHVHWMTNCVPACTDAHDIVCMHCSQCHVCAVLYLLHRLSSGRSGRTSWR